MYTGFPGDSDGSESACKAGGPGSISGTGRFSGEGNGSTYSSIFAWRIPSKRSLTGCTPWCHRESDVQNEQLTFSFFRVYIYTCIHSFTKLSLRNYKSLWHMVNENSSIFLYSVQFSSVAQSCLTPWDPMNCSTPGLPVHHQLQEFTQTQVHWVSDAIQPSHPLSSPSPPAPNPSQHQSLFQWVNSSREVAKVLEFQL